MHYLSSIRTKLSITFYITILALGSSSLYAKTPTFGDYPAKNYTGKNQPLKLNPQSQKYRTLFKDISQQQPNFAGHYVMETVGCGGGCSLALAYNAKTGQSFMLPDSFADCYSEQKGFTANDIFYQTDSRLVVAVGSRYGNQEMCETVYYHVENDGFKQIKND
ncbi:hypothetical protein GPS47_00765 [Acinetobacter haemolyticus]|uniref:Uncharacterized protein n=3 Tax=Acinetobacter haemolyticus TaxID=29430 RepID=A0A1L6KKZ0_ACIHA|nr:hypothetical protein [Acinetobacter haemolyticus]APR69704.1 hypothetical protein AHTJS_04385 [Acinetobacter haemolyticus]ENW21275.1 hypothetical protein F926_01234 [Acinetobacter haemolyticus NIPH 261]MEB6676557.1 hypothetical protein [Acinetobacter haemolyticus]NAR16916.1 hypothetical protein [Acinetobacter haemolyticus]NAR35072.1 hypothetical protein [Acinetobacter haemolyticus]